jgi:hypothetical protein
VSEGGRSFDLGSLRLYVGDVDPGHWRRLITRLTEAARTYLRLGRNKRGDRTETGQVCVCVGDEEAVLLYDRGSPVQLRQR